MGTGARAAGASGRGTDRTGGERTPAQWYCLVFGATLLVAGVLGFAFDSTFDTGSNLNGSKLIGIFEVNGIHNLVHVASGLVLLAMAPKRATAKAAALTFGVVYLAVTIIGIADGSDVLGLIPVNSADNLLHVAISGLAIVSGVVSSGADRERDPVAGRVSTQSP
jgi:hypothetical protein